MLKYFAKFIYFVKKQYPMCQTLYTGMSLLIELTTVQLGIQVGKTEQ